MTDVETQKYTITGLVDIFDEQNNITGQYPIGSVQELAVDKGNAAVEAGTAELYVEDEAEAAAEQSDADADTTTTPEEEEEVDAAGDEDEEEAGDESAEEDEVE